MSMVSRARTIMGNIKDESGALIDPAVAAKFSDALIVVNGPITNGNGAVITNPTNEQKSAFYIRQLREWHRSILVSSRAPAAIESARSSTAATASTETSTDLGSD